MGYIQVNVWRCHLLASIANQLKCVHFFARLTVIRNELSKWQYLLMDEACSIIINFHFHYSATFPINCADKTSHSPSQSVNKMLTFLASIHRIFFIHRSAKTHCKWNMTGYFIVIQCPSIPRPTKHRVRFNVQGCSQHIPFNLCRVDVSSEFGNWLNFPRMDQLISDQRVYVRGQDQEHPDKST